MKAKQTQRESAAGMSSSVATRCKSMLSQWFGQTIIITTAMMASITAGVAGQQS